MGLNKKLLVKLVFGLIVIVTISIIAINIIPLIDFNGQQKSTPAEIYIDDLDTRNTWEKTAHAKDWCSGSGTLEDPYIIKDITVEGQKSPTCLKIQNSIAHFKVQNCTFKTKLYGDSNTIELFNISNGEISFNRIDPVRRAIFMSDCTNLNISYNEIIGGNKGILLARSDNNILQGNTLYTSWNAISLIYSNNNRIMSNTIDKSDTCIDLYDNSRGNLIAENSISQYTRSGIVMDRECHQVEIINNFISSYYSGISSHRSNLLQISNNTIQSSEFGISISGSECNLTYNLMYNSGITLVSGSGHSIDTTNLVNGKKVYFYCNKIGLELNNFFHAGQVILKNCDDSKIANLNLSESSYGLILIDSSGIEINNISVSYNNRDGFFIEGCQNIIITNSCIKENRQFGLFPSSSNNITLIENEISHNIEGIHASCVTNLIIKNNTFSFCDTGVRIFSEGNHIISNNYILNNNIGLHLYITVNTVISNNTIKGNFQGIYESFCEFNNISYNSIEDNNEGIYLRGCNNITISNNTIKRSVIGIYLYISSNITIIMNIFKDNSMDIFEKNSTDNIIVLSKYSKLFNSFLNSKNFTRKRSIIQF